MALRTLNHSIFKLAGGLLCLTSLAILISVWVATTNHAQNQVARDLEVGQGVFTQVLASREAQLFNSADVLTADFGFKQSVASRDTATIASALQNHGERISADLMALTTLEGEVISSTSGGLANLGSPLKEIILNAIEAGGAVTILEIDQRLYQVILLTVDAPTPIAVALVGFEINLALINELKKVTKLNITVQSMRSSTPDLLISSLPERSINDALANVDLTMSVFRLPFGNEHTYISKRFVLSETSQHQVWIILTENMANVFSEFNFLQIKISLISLLSIILTLLVGAVFARNLTRPLTSLASMAQRIAKGEYNQEVSAKANSVEISNLADAFKGMQDGIRNREVKIKYQASHDLLTGLYNRYKIADIVDDKIASGKPFHAIGLKIVGYRGINDTFGYHSGDACLQSLASRLTALGGHAARLNGSDMLWLPDRAIDEAEIYNLRQELERPHLIGETEINAKLAIGFLSYPEHAEDTESLFRHLSIAVDHACEEADLFKAYHKELAESYLRRLDILGELELALNTNESELAVFYQPKLNLKSGRIEKVEALIRWNSARLGFIPPDLFIPIAEQAGLINEITDWVINRVIRDISSWRKTGLELQVAINLSVHDVVNPELLPTIIDRLNKSGLVRTSLSFEVTESDLMKEPEQAIKLLNAFRSQGFDLAIDDFGTGYSSLAYLKNMPVTELKIDKSFVLKLNEQPDDQRIVQTIIALAKSFNLEIVAEGVENQAALDLLERWGCDWIQGYYISRPMPSDQLTGWMEEQTNNKRATA